MNKNQKLLLGVAVVGIGGYLLWKSTQKKTFANFKAAAPLGKSKCCGHVSSAPDADGKEVYKCCDRKSYAAASDNKKCEDCMQLMSAGA